MAIEGQYTAKYVPVNNDATKALKSIFGDSYFTVLNRRTQKYEVHDSLQRGSTYVAVVPYDCLDHRILDLVYQCRENIKRKFLLQEMDEKNNKLFEKGVHAAAEKSKEVAKYILNNANNHPSEPVPSKERILDARKDAELI